MTFKKAGFFGGTFDPLHFGHLNLALSLLESCKLDHIFFSPAALSPNKQNASPRASKQARKDLVLLGIKDIPTFSLFDWELNQEGPSYTIDAVKELKKRHPQTELHLILGEDILEGLANWKSIEELLKLAPPLIGTRPNAPIPKLPPSIHSLIADKQVPIPGMDISSTAVRERLKQKKYCKHLVPSEILDFILKKQLY